MTVPSFAEPLSAPQQHVGPLQRHIDWFARRRATQGYAPCTTQEQLRLVTHLRHWLPDRQRGAEALDEPRLDQLLQHRQPPGRMPRPNRVTWQTCLTEWRDAGMLSVPERQDRPREVLEHTFGHYLAHERHRSPATWKPSGGLIRRFLQEHLGADALPLHTVRLQDVSRCLRRHAARGSPKHAQLLVVALRAFCRFLVYRGALTTDVAVALPAVANWRLAALAKALEPEQVTQRLQSCDQAPPTGQRDYAILLLLARRGLRPGEVVAMT